MLTFGVGVPSMSVASYENLLKNARPEGKMLGDCNSWEELDEFGSIIVGSADTVYSRIMEILKHAKVGHLLIQFHLGNMPDALTRKSMRLFASEVAPRLRTDSARLFVREFPNMQGQLTPELAR